MTVTTDQIRALREKTCAGVLEIKKALESTNGDMDAATELLRAKGLDKAAKKAERKTHQGRVQSYIHGDAARIGVLVEVNCETDFVARTPGFQALVHNIAMQIAAASPLWVDDSDIPADLVAAKRDEFSRDVGQKPPEIAERIVTGKMNKWLDEVVLLRQPYIRTPETAIRQVVMDAIATIGENIVVKRFARFELDEGQ